MKTKEVVIPMVVILILGAYLFLRNSDRSQYQIPSLPSVTGEEISRMEISSSGHAIELTRHDDLWQIGQNKYPADESRIKDILSVLGSLKLTALVSESEAYSRYDLTDEKKIAVKAWAGDRLVRAFDIGKAADTYQHTFIRLGDDPNVYHARNNFRRTFDQTVESLRDKTALSFSSSDITEIEITSEGRRLALSLENHPAGGPSSEEAASETAPEGSTPVWVTEDGTVAETDAVESLLSQLAFLTCDSYLENKQKKAFNTPAYTVTVKGNQTYTLSVFEKDASDVLYPAVSSQNDFPFSLNETTGSRLAKTLEPLLGAKKAP